jgi:hypothetical protein
MEEAKFARVVAYACGSPTVMPMAKDDAILRDVVPQKRETPS